MEIDGPFSSIEIIIVASLFFQTFPNAFTRAYIGY